MTMKPTRKVETVAIVEVPPNDARRLPRQQSEARRVLRKAAPFACCAICGPGHAVLLNIAHLNHQSRDNAPANLAWLCWNHHRMYDAGLYPAQAIRLLQAHWQRTKGVSDFGPMLKDAARRAVAKRSPEARTASAKKAWATMRQRQP
jgi:hypothetical protein